MPAADRTRVAWAELLTGSHAPALVLVCLGVWLHAADSLVVATMMPAMIADVGGAALVGWTVALYEIGSIVAGAASGLMALRFGIRIPMAAAAVVFAAGCAISAGAPSMPVVLLGRLLQGLGGGGLMALSFVAVSLLFPIRLIPRVMAAVSTLWGMSAFLGPLIGGVFVEVATWRAGFWFFALQAVGLSLWIAVGIRVPVATRRADGAARLPIVRLLVLSFGVVAVAYAGIEIDPLRTPLGVLAGGLCFLAFLRLDAAAAADRLLPHAPFDLKTPQGSALLMILCFSTATIAILVYGPLLVTRLHETSALVAGYIVALSSIGWSVMAVLVSGAPDRHDPAYIATGMAVVAASIVGFAYSVPAGPLWLIAVCAVAEGAGFGMAWTFILRRATALAPRAETERVSAAIPTVQRLGYAVGAAYVGIVANAAGFADTPGRDGAAPVAVAVFLSGLPIVALGLVAMARFVRFRPRA